MKDSVYILYLEDDSDDREFFRLALNETAPMIGLVLAGNGREALNFLAAATELPVYIYTDINMPLMSGLEFLRHLREDKRINHIRVIVLTTSAYDLQVAEARALGIDDFIIKPNDVFHLMDVLKESFDKAIGGVE